MPAIQCQQNYRKKYEQTTSVKRSRGSGRPRKTTHEEDRDIVTIYESDRFKNPKATASDANLVCGQPDVA